MWYCVSENLIRKTFAIRSQLSLVLVALLLLLFPSFFLFKMHWTTEIIFCYLLSGSEIDLKSFLNENTIWLGCELAISITAGRRINEYEMRRWRASKKYSDSWHSQHSSLALNVETLKSNEIQQFSFRLLIWKETVTYANLFYLYLNNDIIHRHTTVCLIKMLNRHSREFVRPPFVGFHYGH